MDVLAYIVFIALLSVCVVVWLCMLVLNMCGI
jgi:hypothetical protein